MLEQNKKIQELMEKVVSQAKDLLGKAADEYI